MIIRRDGDDMYTEELMWACDRLMHVMGAQDACEASELANWHTDELYLRAKIERIQRLM